MIKRDTDERDLEFGFGVYRNLNDGKMQADVQNKLGEPMGKAIKEAGVGAEQKNDSRFPSVVPGIVCE